MEFLDAAKTEREAVKASIALAKKQGFVPLENTKSPLKPGERIYVNHRGKALILFVRGRRPLNEGISIAAAHLDSPRLDLKMQPLYESGGLAFFDTHYYGMIKPYQWTGIPLALHGTLVCKDGRTVELRIGEDPADPVFLIADLLPHLSKKQMEGSARDLVRADDLDLLAGTLRENPEDSAGAEGDIKRNLLRILGEKYGIGEADLVSAELSALPAFKTRELGLDRSMIAAYGQDDKVCAYPALTSLFSPEQSEYSSCVILSDKEETGSMGATGMRSPYFSNFIEDLGEREGIPARKILPHSFCISADVNTAWHPLYSEVLDPQGKEARLGRGVILFRYWGTAGKENTNEASAETTAALRRILDEAGILWQTGEGGRVGCEESGTLAHYLAEFDIPSIDLGVPILSMHSPCEAAAKSDVYMMHRALRAFFNRTTGPER
jgi:aspartyl aminopeptidase